jgi:hypothetical protein
VVVQHSIRLNRSIDVMAQAVVDGAWFRSLDFPNRATVGAGVVGIQVLGKITVEIGEPVNAEGHAEFPVTWQATYIRRPFPVMVGKLELASAGDGVTRLTVCATYELPTGRQVKMVDRALIHNDAQAAVNQLANRIATGL